MRLWILEPEQENMVVVYDTWSDGTRQVITGRYWRSLSLTFEENPEMESGCHLNVSPLLDENNHLEMYDCYDSAVIQDPAGTLVEKSYTDNEMRQFEDALESDGFDIQTTELWIYGPYSVSQDIY